MLVGRIIWWGKKYVGPVDTLDSRGPIDKLISVIPRIPTLQMKGKELHVEGWLEVPMDLVMCWLKSSDSHIMV